MLPHSGNPEGRGCLVAPRSHTDAQRGTGVILPDPWPPGTPPPHPRAAQGTDPGVRLAGFKSQLCCLLTGELGQAPRPLWVRIIVVPTAEGGWAVHLWWRSEECRHFGTLRVTLIAVTLITALGKPALCRWCARGRRGSMGTLASISSKRCPPFQNSHLCSREHAGCLSANALSR